jgi:hypothetical protein
MKKSIILSILALMGCVGTINAQRYLDSYFGCNNIFLEYNPMKIGNGGPEFKKGVAFRWTDGYCLGDTPWFFAGGIMAAYMWDETTWPGLETSLIKDENKNPTVMTYDKFSFLTGGGLVEMGYAIKFCKGVYLVPCVELLALFNGGWGKGSAGKSSMRIQGIKFFELEADFGGTLHLGRFAIKGGYTQGLTRYVSGANRTMWHAGIGYRI